jgi:hypothetical protein
MEVVPEEGKNVEEFLEEFLLPRAGNLAYHKNTDSDA